MTALMFQINHQRKKKSDLSRTVSIIEIDKPWRIDDILGPQIYSQDSVDQLLQIFAGMEFLFGELVSFDSDRITLGYSFVEDMTHTITDIFQEGEFVMVSLEFMNNQKGREALKMFSEGLAILRPTIRGRMGLSDNNPGVVEVKDLISIDLIPLKDEHLPQDIDWIKITQ
jgi:hypothetical protein